MCLHPSLLSDVEAIALRMAATSGDAEVSRPFAVAAGSMPARARAAGQGRAVAKGGQHRKGDAEGPQKKSREGGGEKGSIKGVIRAAVRGGQLRLDEAGCERRKSSS